MAAVLAWITRVPVSTAGHLLTGWMAFIVRSCVRMTVNWNAVATALVCMGLLIVGGHPFLKWLISSVASAPRRHTDASAAQEPAAVPVVTRWSWIRTAQLLGVFVLLFMAGIAFIGLIHQTAWLATSPEPLREYRLNMPYFDGKWNTRFIANGVDIYVDVYHQLPPNGPAPELQQGSHSWQTRILPFMSYYLANVDFKLDWENEKNVPAFKRFVREFLNPDIGVLRDGRGYAVSHYAGNRHLFARERPLTKESLDRGVSNLIVCGEIADNFTAWGDPANLRDPIEGINRTATGFGGADGRGANFVMLDGSVRFLSANTDHDVLSALATPGVSQSPAKAMPDSDAISEARQSR